MAIHVVVIGAVALGPKAACRCKRLMPDAKVTLIDQSSRISYGGCGIPYYVSGEVTRIEELQSTPYGIVRDADFFAITKGVDVLINTRAISIDRANKKVSIKNVHTGEEQELAYDKLVLAMGSTPNRPSIPGIELQGITPITTLEEAELVKAAISGGTVNNAVIVGGGFIGLEMAVAMADMWGIPTTVVEIAPQIMPSFSSATLARMMSTDLEQGGVSVLTNERVIRFEGEHGKVQRVITNKRTLEAELVVLSAGIAPNTKIAQEAGLDVTERGTIVVDSYMRTSDPDIYAGGDCVTIPNLVTGKPGYFPLGSMANRQGRVIGSNLAGASECFAGAVGSWGVKLFELSACGVGLSIESAIKEGFDAISVQVQQVDKAHFYPEHGMMSLELVVDRPSRRVLGLQGLGNGDAVAARVNAVAGMLAYKPTVEDISNLEIIYSPPFASAMDIINVVGNVADNILSGHNRPITQEEFEELWLHRDDQSVYFLDTRLERGAATEAVAKHPAYWHNIPLEELQERLQEIPQDKPVILLCNTGLRSYESLLILDSLGRKNTKTLFGGLVASQRMGITI